MSRNSLLETGEYVGSNMWVRVPLQSQALKCIFNSFMTEAAIIQKPYQWTGFYMIMASVMKELKDHSKNMSILVAGIFRDLEDYF